MKTLRNLSTLPSRYPIYTLVILAITTVLLGSGLNQLAVRNSFDGDLPADDPINTQIQALKDNFGERSTVLIGVQSSSIYNTNTIEKVKTISEDLLQMPFVIPDEITSIATIKNTSNRSWGVETSGFLDGDLSSREAMRQLEKDLVSNESIIDKLVSKDGTLTVIAAVLEDDFDGGEVYQFADSLAAANTGPEVIHITGAPILVEDVQRGISGDIRVFIPIALVFIFIGFYICFRTIPGVLFPVIMVVISIVWTMGTMGYMGLPITVVSNALPVIMVAVASSYGIHFMHAYYSSISEGGVLETLTKTMAKVGKPILITGITSALGSGSLLIFKIVSLKEFGIIGAIGFSYATIICLTMLPALCVLIKPQPSQLLRFEGLKRRLGHLTFWAEQHSGKVLFGYMILLPVFVFFASQIIIGDDYLQFFPKGNKGRIAAETFNDKLSGVRVLDIMIDAGDYGGIKDPQFYADLKGFEAYLNSHKDIGSVHSYTNVIDHIHKSFINSKIPNDLNSQQIAQYLMLYEMSAAPGAVFSMRDEAYGKARIQAYLNTSNPDDHKSLYDEIVHKAPGYFKANNAEVIFGGDIMHRIVLANYIVSGKIMNIVLALIIVLLCCTVIFRSIKRGLLTVIPIATSLLMVFGCMGILGIRLGISTSLLTAMIVGIGIDFSVHYLISFFKKYKKSNNAVSAACVLTSKDTGKAITFDAISNIAGFSILSFSGFMPVQHFGWLLAFSMLLIFLNTIVLYPALLGAVYNSRSHTSGQTIPLKVSVES